MSAGHLPKRPRKCESGSQLLARLINRADLSSLDPDVFDKVPASLPLNSLQSSSHSKIIEIYGPEGVGKTEMVLHYVAKVCLPANWNGHSLNGLGSKVIFIDTEFKFSVFRLAIIMEKQLLDLCEKFRERRKESVHNIPPKSSSLSFSDTTVNTERIPDSRQLETAKENLDTPAGCSQTNLSQNSFCRNTAGGDIHKDVCEEPVDVVDEGVESYPSKQSFHGGRESHEDGELTLTSQDVENIIQDSLGRVQVNRVLTTEQLLLSLLSLEDSLSCDPLISMVAIDTISAFYWTDKLGDLDNPSCTELNMSPIANIISKYATDFGITHLIVKSALINNKRVWCDDWQDSKNRNNSNSGAVSSFSNGLAGTRNEKILQEHVEFLGKSWSKLRKKRFVLTRSVDRVETVGRSVWCSEWTSSKQFTCTDDGLRFC